MEFWKSLSGTLTISLTSAVPEEILDSIILAKIPIFHVEQRNELTYQLSVRRSDYRNLCSLLKRRGATMEILQKRGLYWAVKSFCKRPVLVSTLMVLLLSSFYFPSRILFVTVEGNKDIPSRQILSAAEICGIRFGASRKTVRSEKVKNALLSAVPQLQWAGVNTSGCTATISVRERIREEPSQQENYASNIIADRDGYILSATITGGTGQCQPGETVISGQVLISGYTDCGICIRTARAEGEILAETRRSIHAVMPEKYAVARPAGGNKYQISLLLGKKRINLWKDSRISDTSCGRMYEEYYVSLPGGFRLPIALCISQYTDYELLEAAVPEGEAKIQLQQFSENYVIREMVAGQILKGQQILSRYDGIYRFAGEYICTEMIGKEQRQQIGDFNGKRS